MKGDIPNEAHQPTVCVQWKTSLCKWSNNNQNNNMKCFVCSLMVSRLVLFFLVPSVRKFESAFHILRFFVYACLCVAILVDSQHSAQYVHRRWRSELIIIKSVSGDLFVVKENNHIRTHIHIHINTMCNDSQ